MKLYHGTNKGCFDTLQLKGDRENLAEGRGIYMTDTLNVAKDYGCYIHHIEVNDSHISDFTNKQYIEKTIQKTLKAISLEDIYYDIDMTSIIEDILYGTGSILNIGREIGLQLSSYENLTNKYEDVLHDIDTMINTEIKNHIKDVIKYKSKGIDGIVYLCFRNPKVVKVKKIIELN